MAFSLGKAKLNPFFINSVRDEANLKYEDNLKYEYCLKYEDNIKYENYL